ncbi:MAG: ABC transporter permease [Bacteroidales bacterium]|nr:ABC transporter permease [Bacteroidales bacterium]
MIKILYQIGEYLLLLKRIFSRPERGKIYLKQTIEEIGKIGINSIGIVTIISIFMGAVIAIQYTYNIENPLIPLYLVGLATRDSMILEFSSTMVGLVLAGKVGSNIASELGTMRVTEQIDALESMGINSASYLILPKIIAAIFFFPLLTILSMFVGIWGGWLAVVVTKILPAELYIQGLHYAFVPFYVTYTLIKSFVFGFLVVTVSAYYGYYCYGGALEVGQASTKAVVYSSLMILLFNVILTQLLLTR